MRKLFLALVLIAAMMIAGAPASAGQVVFMTGHVQNVGWSAPSFDEVGVAGGGLRLEAVQFTDPSIIARGHVQNIGWQAPTTDLVGTTGRSLRLEAVQLTPRFEGWRVWCQAYVQGIGWMPPVADGATCGTTGRSLRLEAVRIWMEST